jgi:putative FmdB family regulatory protein
MLYYTLVVYVCGGENMPIYEYRCTECGEQFELFLRSTAQKAVPICPRCGSTEVEKALSLFGVAGKSGSSRASAAACAPTST